jgi:hypothetical protein
MVYYYYSKVKKKSKASGRPQAAAEPRWDSTSTREVIQKRKNQGLQILHEKENILHGGQEQQEETMADIRNNAPFCCGCLKCAIL